MQLLVCPLYFCHRTCYILSIRSNTRPPCHCQPEDTSPGKWQPNKCSIHTTVVRVPAQMLCTSILHWQPQGAANIHTFSQLQRHSDLL